MERGIGKSTSGKEEIGQLGNIVIVKQEQSCQTNRQNQIIIACAQIVELRAEGGHALPCSYWDDDEVQSPNTSEVSPRYPCQYDCSSASQVELPQRREG